MPAPEVTAIPHGQSTDVELATANTWYGLLFADSSELATLTGDAAFDYAEGITDSASTVNGHAVALGGVIGDKVIPSSNLLFVRSATAAAVVSATGSDRKGRR